MKFTVLKTCAVGVGLCFSSLSMAEDPMGFYLGGVADYYIPDSSRDLDEGWGSKFFLGFPLSESTKFEVIGSGQRADSEIPGVKRYVGWGLGGDVLVLMSQGPFRPFFLLGGGYAYDKTPSEEGGAGYANAGLGALVQLSDNLFLRGEGRYVNLFGDPLENGDDNLGDVHVSLGLQATLGTPPPPPPVVIVKTAPAPPPPPADSDGDGVLDRADQCPNTPKGIQVSATGCPLDGDRDGVPDYLDKCPNTPYGLRVDATGCVREAQTIVLQNVNFEFNKDRLTAGAQEVLTGVAQGLKSQADIKVEIAGHTDSVGSDQYNLNLSKRRAESVRQFLLSQGVTSAQVIARGYGESEPATTNTTDEGRAENRRVEFRVLSK